MFALTFDSNYYKSEISELISKQTGRDLQINGELSLSIFPDIAIKLGKASLSNPEGFANQEFASIHKADISVKFLPLLQKQLRVNSVKLYGLKLNLHRRSDGTTNWQDLMGKPAATQDDSDFSQVISEMVASLTVAGISVKNSQIHWQDELNHQQIALAPFNLETGKYQADKPVDVALDTTIKQQSAMTLSLKASTRLKLNKEKQTFQLDHLNLNSQLSGELAKGGTIYATIKGDVAGNQQTIRVPNLKLSADIKGGYAPQGEIKLSLAGNTQFNVSKQQVTINHLALDNTITGKLMQNGTLNSHINGTTHFDIANQLLTINAMQGKVNLQNGALGNGSLDANIMANTRFDMAKQVLKLANMQSTIHLQNGVLETGDLTATLSGTTQVNLQQSSAQIDGLALATQINSPKIPAGKLQQTAKGSVKLNWANKTGNADLSSLFIKLAGLQLNGSAKIKHLMSTPEVSGHLQSNTFNLSELLKALAITPPKTKKSGLLGATQINTDLTASANGFELSQLTMQLDESTITGNLSIQNFSHPAIYGKLNINRLNVDNYLSEDTAKNNPTPPAAALLPLAAMRNLTMDTRLTIGTLVYSKIHLSQASVRLQAKQGLVQADPISAKLYKGKYQGSIHLDTAKAEPAITMQHNLKGLRSEGLLYDLFEDKLVTGSANLQSDIHTSGNSILDIKKNLAGTINVSFHDGTIRDSNFAKKMEIAVQAFEKKQTDGSGKTEVKFTKLSGDWTVKHGIFSTDNMAMKSPRFRVEGKGDVDIVKEQLDFKLNIGRKKAEGQRNIFIPFRIYGAFDKLHYQLKLDELFKQLAAEDLEKAKQKAREQLKAEQARLKEKLEQQKQAEIDKLNKRKQAEIDKLKARRDKEKKRLQERLNQQKEKLNQNLKEKLGEKLNNDVGKQLEDKLKQKLKGLF